ncbi:hypothetical protein BD413DRAFT_174132 [Trametes elegans]|nr:hypothetical protein BD413DRAFT_174132 [Trametes elegans]
MSSVVASFLPVLFVVCRACRDQRAVLQLSRPKQTGSGYDLSTHTLAGRTTLDGFSLAADTEVVIGQIARESLTEVFSSRIYERVCFFLSISSP